MKLLGQLTILLAVAGFAMANDVRVPEIDGSSATSVVALVSGALMILRANRKK